VLTLAYTGLRWGELAGLRVSSLGMLRKRVTVSENAVQAGTEMFVGTPKTHKLRDVPLPNFLLDDLARQCEGKGRDDLLFRGEDGGHLHRPHAESGWFTKAVHAVQATTNAQRARELATTGAVITPEFPTITPHDLRHTAASLAVSAGANVKVVQRMLGHKSATMTLDIYAGLFDDDLESVATKLDEARAASVLKMCSREGQTGG
jgi:integrase